MSHHICTGKNIVQARLEAENGTRKGGQDSEAEESLAESVHFLVTHCN